MPRSVLSIAVIAVLSVLGGFGMTSVQWRHEAQLTASATMQLQDDALSVLQDDARARYLALSRAERDTVAASRTALVDAGFSDAYVDRHLVFLGMGEVDGATAVRWAFVADAYRILLTDVAEDGEHSIGALLGQAHDFTHLLSHAQARRLLEECIGPFSRETTLLRALTPGGSTKLLLSARSTAQGSPVGMVDVETGECRKGK